MTLTGRTWTVFLAGHWPTLNNLNDAKANRFAYHKLKMQWQHPAAWNFKSAGVPRLKRVWLSYVHQRAERRGDKSNLAAAAMKIIEDALVGAKVIQNDGWNFVEGFDHRFVVDPREGVEVTIHEVA